MIRYGIESPDARLVASDIERRPATLRRSTSSTTATLLGDVSLRVPGEHNVLNALAAIASGLALGVTVDAMATGSLRSAASSAASSGSATSPA